MRERDFYLLHNHESLGTLRKSNIRKCISNFPFLYFSFFLSHSGHLKSLRDRVRLPNENKDIEFPDPDPPEIERIGNGEGQTFFVSKEESFVYLYKSNGSTLRSIYFSQLNI